MRSQQSIFFYVSGHGFGHATRSAEIIAALNRMSPETDIHVRTTAPKMIFDEAGCRCTIESVALDVGVVQSDSLNMDIPATINAYSALMDELPRIVDHEIKQAKMRHAGLIVSDVSAAAFRISNSLDIPGTAISNFSWDWIYEVWQPEFPHIHHILDSIREDYGRCDLLLLLPFSEILPAFHHSESIPLVGRRATIERNDVRFRLDIPDSKPVILLSFGGMGLSPGQFDQLDQLNADYLLISVGDHNCPGRILDRELLQTRSIRYQDLVAAMDVVVTKPGYGIVAECSINRVRMLYTDRGPFREYDVLVEQMERYIPAEYIDRCSFEAGNWLEVLSRLLRREMPSEIIPSNGAEIAAGRLLQLMENWK